MAPVEPDREQRRTPPWRRWAAVWVACLWLPVGAVVAQAYHTVEPGDTLYRLARLYDLTVAQLQDLNDLDGTTLRVGQELLVRPAPRVSVRVVDRTRPRGLDRSPPRDTSPEASRDTPPEERVLAWVYPSAQVGQRLASGDRYDPEAAVVGHAQLPLGTRVRLQNRATGRQVEAVVADRLIERRAGQLGVSAGVADALGLTPGRLQPVVVTLVRRP